MNTDEIAVRVIETIAERLERPEAEITPATSFSDDLKADSLALMELVLALEETFDIQASDEDPERLRTVQDAIDVVTEHLRKRA